MKEPDGSQASVAASVAEAGQQVAIRTPSRELTPGTINATSTKDLHAAKNTSVLQLEQRQGTEALLGGQTSIKNISQNATVRDLDVETNYLRNSA